MNQRKNGLRVVVFFAMAMFSALNLSAQFSYTNKNPSLSILPYGSSFTYSVSYQDSYPQNGELLTISCEKPSGNTSAAVYPFSYTFTYSISGLGSSDDGNYSLYFSDHYYIIATTTPITVHVSPAILTQPTNTICLNGASTSMGIAAGPNTASFQWIDAATGNVIANTAAFTPTSANNGERLYCKISNTYGSVSSSSAVLTVGASPSIATQPTNINAIYGTAANFAVNANGTAPLYYQWYKNGTAISGANLSYFTIASVTNTDVGTYQVSVTNSYGNTNSVAVALNVGNPIAITNQPTNITIMQGQSAVFTASASGSTPIFYQWTKNGGYITAATTNSTYSIPNASLSSAGTYAVIITNLFSRVLSSNAVLTVLAPPSITKQPANTNILKGNTAGFTVTCSGTSPFSYQWYEGSNALADTSNIIGSLSNVLAILSASTNNTGGYYLIVTNLYGTATSTVATLNVGIPPASIGFSALTNGISLTMPGTPNFPYVLESTSNLMPPIIWQRILTNSANSNGLCSFMDGNTSSNSGKFYRVVWP